MAREIFLFIYCIGHHIDGWIHVPLISVGQSVNTDGQVVWACVSYRVMKNERGGVSEHDTVVGELLLVYVWGVGSGKEKKREKSR